MTMLRSIDAILRFRYLIVAAATAIIVFGASSLLTRPIDLLPEFSAPLVEIQTEAHGLAATEVEALITVPLEEFLAGMPWLKSQRSTSINGLSSIVLEFMPGTDVIQARQMAQERLINSAILPNVSKPPILLQPVSSINRVMMIGLTSERLSMIDLSVLARWNVAPRLMGVAGVANASIWGERARQLQVLVDPAELRAKGVTLMDVIRATGDGLWSSPLSFLNASTPGVGGFIDTPSQRLDIRHALPISSPEDLGRMAFKTANGILQLADVATVVESNPQLIGDAVVDGKPGLMLVVEKFPWANTREVTKGVEAMLAVLKPGLAGVEIDTSVFRPADFVAKAARSWTFLVAGAALLAAISLSLYLFNWRSALVALITVPVAVMIALIVLLYYDATINVVILAGLVAAIPIMLSDALLDVQAIRRRLRAAADDPGGRAAELGAASVQVRTPAAYATAIVLISTVPFLILDGPFWHFLRPMFVAYLVAVVASFVVAATLAPALSFVLFTSSLAKTSASRGLAKLRRPYESLLETVLRLPRLTVVAASVLVLAGLAPFALLGYDWLPSFEERDLVVRLEAEPGTSLPRMGELVADARSALRNIDGVRGVSAVIGRAVTSDRIVDINSAEIWVGIGANADYGSTAGKVRDVMRAFPVVGESQLSFSTSRMFGALSEKNEEITVRIYGPDIQVLRRKADEVANALASFDALDPPVVERLVDGPNLAIEVDLAAAERFGLKPGDIRRSAATLLAGIGVGTLFEDQKVFEVFVWGKPEIRTDIADIKAMTIDVPGGGHVRLDQVATVTAGVSPVELKHEAASGRIDVSAGVGGGGRPATEEITARLQAIDFPLEYHFEFLDDSSGRNFGELFVVYGLSAAAAVLLLLHAAFRRWSVALLAFLTPAVALAGSVLALFVSGGDLAIGSLAGIVAVIGLAAHAAMVSLGRYQDEGAFDDRQSAVDRIRIATLERSGPAFASAMTIALVFAPLLYFRGPGLEILHPMAIVIVGGVAASILAVLFVLPAAYLTVAQIKEQRAPRPALDLAAA